MSEDLKEINSRLSSKVIRQSIELGYIYALLTQIRVVTHCDLIDEAQLHLQRFIDEEMERTDA